MAQTTRLLLMGKLSTARLARLQAGCAELIVDLDLAENGPLDALFAWDRDVPAIGALLARYPDRLRWVHVRRVGQPPAFLRLLEQHPAVTLTTSSGGSGLSIAEYVLAVTLALYRRLPELRDRQHRADWARGFEVTELRGQTACIVGLGDIGRSVARLLRPFGVRLLGVRRQAEPAEEVDETHPAEALPALLPRTNILILAAPLTAQTRQLIDAAALARLPRGSYLVNVGRGALLDETALLEALRSGQLAGAALDVFNEEPLPPSSPLWSLPNLIVTPHTSTHTEASDDRALEIFLDNLGRYRRGEPLRNVIDLALGY